MGNHTTWIDEIAAATPTVINRVQSLLPRTFPEPVATAIFTGLHQQAALL